MDIANRITLLRKEKSWSQTELAKLVGCSREIISKYEKDNVMPSILLAKKIADAFGVTLDYLVGEGQNATFDKNILDRIQAIQSLEPQTQDKVFFLLDVIIRDARARKAYAS